MTTDAGGPNQLRAWLEQLQTLDASDLHLREGLPPFVRAQGVIHPLDGAAPLDRQSLATLVQSLLGTSALRSAELERRGQVDFSHEAGTARFRVNVFRQQDSTSLSMRLLPSSPPALGDLGLPSVVEYMARSRRGLILVTGASSSGKTTTLSSIIDHINAAHQRHIVTIEDPIEIVHRTKRSLVTQREIGTDTLDFAEGLRAALRQDPDVILIGEIRDAETMRVALSAAQTGHLVLASLHTIDVTDTIARVISLIRRDESEDQQARALLASSLVGVVAQRLVRSVDGPLVPAVETMINTSRISDCIVTATQTSHIHDVIADGGYDGMQTFGQSLAKLVVDGVVDVDEAFATSTNRQAFRMLLQNQYGYDPGRVRPATQVLADVAPEAALEAVDSGDKSASTPAEPEAATHTATVDVAQPVAAPLEPELLPTEFSLPPAGIAPTPGGFMPPPAQFSPPPAQFTPPAGDAGPPSTPGQQAA